MTGERETVNGKRSKNILITGLPGIGKTTLVRRVAEELRELSPVGFYTQEIRQSGTRLGFEAVSLNGRRQILSGVSISSGYSVGKYHVDLTGFDNFLETIPFLNRETHLAVVDEIGKMECFSEKFVSIVRNLLASHIIFAATIALKGSGFIAEVKQRPDVTVLEVTHQNRDSLQHRIASEVKFLLQFSRSSTLP